jgi:hypothetical protein
MTLELDKTEAGRLEALKNGNKLSKRSGFSPDKESPIVLSNGDEIPELDADTTFVHFSFRPTVKQICCLLDTCPRLKKIQAPTHVLYALSDSAHSALKFRNIELICGTIPELKRKKVIPGW